MTDDKVRALCTTTMVLGIIALAGFTVHTCRRVDVRTEEETKVRGAYMAAERQMREERQREQCQEFTFIPLEQIGAECPAGMDMGLVFEGSDSRNDIKRVTCRCPSSRELPKATP